MEPEHKIEYHDNGQVAREYWRVNGQTHRLDGPAVVWYYDNGQVASEEWLVDGKRHRLDGPAYVLYKVQGEVIGQEFWVRDQVDCAKLGQFICSPARWRKLLLNDIPIEFGVDYVVDLGLVDWWLGYRPQDREYLYEA